MLIDEFPIMNHISFHPTEYIFIFQIQDQASINQ